MDIVMRQRLAEGLANNPLLTDLLGDMRTAAVLQWQSTPDQEKQQMAWHTVRAIDTLKNRLQAEFKQSRGAT